MNGKIKRILGGLLSALVALSVAMPAFAAETQEIGAPRNTSVPAAATTYSSISIMWDKPEDYKDITGYRVYMDGNPVKTTAANETYYTAENLNPDSEHTFTVKSLEGTKESAASSAVTAKTDKKGTVIDVTASPYNAAGDGTTNDTEAIQAAIDECGENGVVILPENKTFLSGALDLGDNMTLEINGTLLGSDNPADYEKKGDTNNYDGGKTTTGSVYTAEAQKRLIWSRSEGWEQYCYRSLINIGYLTEGVDYGSDEDFSVSNVKITGTGSIMGSTTEKRTQYAPIRGQASDLAIAEGNSAETFYDLTASNENGVTTNNIRSRIRGRLINISNAQNVYIKGVELSRPPMWTVHMIYSDSVTTNGVSFETTGYRNGDGWDPDSSSNCTVYNCNFHTGDDSVAIKSGKNPEGNAINRPSQNIKVIGCTSNGGLGLAVGSEMSGGVDGVLVRDCNLAKTRYGVELKANAVRGGYIRDFNVEDSTIDQVLIHSVTYNADGEPASAPPVFRDIHFKNTHILCRDGYNDTWLGTGIELDGFDNEDCTSANYINGVTFEDITLGTENNVDQTVSLKRSDNITFNNVLQTDGNKPIYSLSNTSDITVDGEDAVTLVPTFTKTIEAERMKPENFTVEANSYASNGKVLKIGASSVGTVGNAQAKYNGSVGVKAITVTYFDENDGDEKYELYINDVKADEWEANKDLGSDGADSKTLTSHTTEGVELAKGDIIKLAVTVTRQYGSGRIDKIEVNGEEENVAPSAPTGLLTNELENPLNVEEPTFGWLVNDENENEIQTAYEIIITDEVTGKTVWDSGKVQSSNQSYVPFDAGQGSNGNDEYKANFISYGGLSNKRVGSVGIWRNERLGVSTMIKASYDSTGNLVGIVSDSVPAGESGTQATAFSGAMLDDPDVSLDMPQGGSIKVFLWEGESIGAAMKPAALPLEIQTNGTQLIDNLGEINFAALETGHPYSWQVRTWDKDDEVSPYSESAYFTTGLTDSEWNDAEWISDGTDGADKAQSSYNHYWYARTSKAIAKTPVKAAAYFAGAQDYDLFVNGEEIGRGQSFDYTSEARYQGWDITNAVKSVDGSVTIGALVRTYGAGQGRAPVSAGLIGYVKLYYNDGTSDIITTNTTDWQVSQTTPLNEVTSKNTSSMRSINGTDEGDFREVYTASKAQEGFSTASFTPDSSWKTASARTSGTQVTVNGVVTDDGIAGTPIAALSKPVPYEVEPVDIKVINGVTVADFGTVIPARPEVTFKNGTEGTSVTITGGYILGSDGKVATGDKPQQSTAMTWTYIQKDGEQTYNAWDHLGFRYLQIPDCGETFTKETLKAKVVHTNVPSGRDSTFVTSNETLNGVYELMKRSSLYGIQNEFVDTPTREKGQFTDDARNISEASMATQFEREASRKAINQFLASADRYWTDENGTILGRFNSVYPNGDGKRDIPEYSVNMPQWIWNYYMNTGDIATLKKAYPYMYATAANYIAGCIPEAGKTNAGLVTQLTGGSGDYQYGIVDWPKSGRFDYGISWGAMSTVNMLSKHAFDVVGLAAAELAECETDNAVKQQYSDDADEMKQYSNALKAAINSKLKNSSGLYVDSTGSSGNQGTHVSQHANSYALAFDIVTDDNREAVAEFVAGQGMKQGPMTADILVKGLFNSGENTAALKLLTNENDYGWANVIKQGGSFTWESWDADGSTTNYSQSHAWGATAASDILRNFAGVQILEPGAGKVRIAPVYVDITSLNASVQTERGAVGVSYTRTEADEQVQGSESSYSITLTIPANMTAEVELPDIGMGTYKKNSKTGMAVANSFTLGSGTYTYVFDGEITPPEKLTFEEPEDPVRYDSEIYDFSTLTNTEFPNTYKGDKVFNEYITLHFNDDYSNISSGGNGFDLYNSTGAYIEFTPPSDGKISLNMRVRSGGLYMSTNTVRASDEQLLSNTGTSALTDVGTFDVKGGTKYCIYNKGGNLSSNPISVKSITYLYPHVPLEGIGGSVNTDTNTYTWEIGDAETAGVKGEKYSDTNDYADLTVSLGAGDSMSPDGIVFSATSVQEPEGNGDGPHTVSDTERYLLIEPKYNGTMSVTITFTSGNQNNNRIYYRDFADGSVNLAECEKSGDTMTGSNISANTKTTMTLDMTAGHTYVLYTYQNSSLISGISYKYSE